MPIQADSKDTPKQHNSPLAETVEEKNLDHAADKASQKAGKTEQHYDQDHDIFTK